MEEWRAVPSFEGKYEVSDQGRVRSRFRVLKQGIHRDGYPQTKLHRNNVPYMRLIHRLVAQVFCPARDGCKEVDHIDGNKLNNSASNLRWVTRHENMRAAQAMGLLTQPDNSGSKNGNAKLVEADLPRIRIMSASGFTQEKIAQFFGVSRRTIGFILKGQRWAK